MATQITNKATLSYSSGSTPRQATSNIASITLQGPLEATKNSLEKSYRMGDVLTYNLFVKNTSQNTLNNITVEDDLGTYTHATAGILTPLTYVGPAQYFIDDEPRGVITPTTSTNKITYTIPLLAGGSILIIQHKVLVNDKATATPVTSKIINNIKVNASGLNSAVVATNTIPVDSYADVTIEKTMSPNPIIDGSALTYTFKLSNYGNIEASAIKLEDTFTTIPDITSVTVDGVSKNNYDFDELSGTFLYPAAGTAEVPAEEYNIAAASFSQDETTGVVTITPKESIIVIEGTI